MSSQFNKHLTKAIADFAIFLEFTGDDSLNPDSAVEAMEQLAAELQLLDEADKLTLISQFKHLAPAFKDAQHIEFVENLGEMLGLE